MPDLTQQINDLLATVPAAQRDAAAALLAQYGPRFFEMAQEDAVQYLRRLMQGDLDVVSELDSKLSNDQWLIQVKTNTARWANVAAYNVTRENLKNEILLKLAPVVLSLLAGLVGL